MIPPSARGKLKGPGGPAGLGDGVGRRQSIPRRYSWEVVQELANCVVGTGTLSDVISL